MVKEPFQEVGHCGFEITVETKTDQAGARTYQLGVRGASAGPMAIFGVYALPEGIPVGTILFGGIGSDGGGAPHPSCFQIFIGSDSEGRFGHKCPRCGQYWRSGGVGLRWPMTCAYCGARGHAHDFMTDGQRSYVHACCDWIQEALSSDSDGMASVKLDDIADMVEKGSSRPSFYYAEQSQQNKFTCAACGAWNDILGRFGYCAGCGTWNGLQELQWAVERIREQINASATWEGAVGDLVAAFDSVARQYAKQLSERVPLSARRRGTFSQALFHDVRARAKDLSEAFDINVFSGMSAEEVSFAAMMFERRHVYEHNGGEVDERYLEVSGDKSVRLKQALAETRESAHRLAGTVLKLARNIHVGFHELLPPESGPIECRRSTRR